MKRSNQLYATGVIPTFKWQSLKEDFHNLVLSIDKMVTFGMFDSTILIKFECGGPHFDLRPDVEYPYLGATILPILGAKLHLGTIRNELADILLCKSKGDFEMRKITLMIMFFTGVSSLFFIQGCAMDKPFVRKGLESIQSIKLVRNETPKMKEVTRGKQALGACLGGGVGVVVARDLYKIDASLDFGEMVVTKFAKRLKKELPELAKINMNIEHEPVGEEFTCESCLIIRFEIKDLILGFMSLGYGGGYGIGTCTIATMKDHYGNLLWGKEFTYITGNYKRNRSSIDEFKADNNKLLNEEMEFAAEKTVSEFIEHLRKGER